MEEKTGQKIIFKNSVWGDYFQSRLIIIGINEQQIKNDWIVRNGFMWNETVDASFIVEPKVKISTLMILTGMLNPPSKSEFTRKLKQKGIKLGWTTLDKDVEIDLSIPSIFNDIRIGKRLLEVVVPSIITDEELKELENAD